MKFNKDNIRNFIHSLQKEKGNRKEIHNIIKRATPAQIKSLLIIAYKYCSGKKKLNPQQNKKVCRGKRKIEQFANTCLSHTLHRVGQVHCKSEGVKRARGLLLNQRGGFFPALIPLFAAIAPLIGKAALAGAVSAGAGLAVKKIADNV